MIFKKLVNWSDKNYSHLPWRNCRSSYKTLVSEFMLQQTTVTTVVKHFEQFIRKYPSIKKLSMISQDQILRDWQGLGYYRRARNLLGAAKYIQKFCDGVIPCNFDQLITIKGIGDYTANAILAIGNNKMSLPVDANLERVISRYYGLEDEKGKKLHNKINQLFQEKVICQEMNQIGPRVYVEALMDLGRSICRARSASCEICPLSSSCLARLKKTPLMYPVQSKEQSKHVFELHLLRIIICEDDKLKVYKKNKDQWLAEQYEIPTFVIYSENEKLKQYPVLNDYSYMFLPSYRTSITKYKITNYVLRTTEKEIEGLFKEAFVWKSPETIHLSVASLKALRI